MGVHLRDDEFLPEPPKFSPEDFERARRDRDPRPLLFEWYKWTGLVANRVASISPDSPSYRNLPAIEIAVLRGLLNRCARLMVAILQLAARRKHAEAIRVLSRCISESAVVARWLCTSGSGQPFGSYLAKGLDAELRLKSDIERNIAERDDTVLKVEKRMLAAIAQLCALAGMSEDNVRAAKSLPNFASLLRDVGHPDLSYTVLQRQGSHAVHGTWPDLIFHYLDVEGGKFNITDNNVEPEGGDFLAVPILVLEAVAEIAAFTLSDQELATDLQNVASDAITEIVRIHRLASGDDYSAV